MAITLNLLPSVAERLADVQTKRADKAARLALLRSADGWPDAPAGRPVTRLEREALALATGQPVPDADPDAAVLQRELQVLDRAAELLDALDARESVPALQTRADGNRADLAGHVAQAVKVLRPLLAGLLPLRELLEETRSIHAERAWLGHRLQQAGDVGSVRLVFDAAVETAAGRLLDILERAEALGKDAQAAGIR
jgi:hypothetical protein